VNLSRVRRVWPPGAHANERGSRGHVGHVEAVDPSGNRSFSDSAYTTTDRDRTPLSTPADLRVTRVTASQIDLTWDASSDDTGIRSHLVAMSPHDGNLMFTGPASATIVGLAPETTYTFTVKAEDLGYNFSAASSPASATTAASTDVTPPTAPTNLFVSDQYCGEVRVRWTQSTDDRTRSPRSATGSSSTASWIRSGPDRGRPHDHVRRRRTEHVRAAGRRQRRQRVRAEQRVPDHAGRLHVTYGARAAVRNLADHGQAA
jgi:Fibronectin type III domain